MRKTPGIFLVGAHRVQQQKRGQVKGKITVVMLYRSQEVTKKQTWGKVFNPESNASQRISLVQNRDAVP